MAPQGPPGPPSPALVVVQHPSRTGQVSGVRDTGLPFSTPPRQHMATGSMVIRRCSHEHLPGTTTLCLNVFPRISLKHDMYVP